MHKSSDERSKLDPNYKKCVFVCYSKGVKGLRFWDPISKKMVINKDAMFNELSMLIEIVETTMLVSNGASPSSMEVQVDFERLSVILERVEPCNPRPAAPPSHELGSVSLSEQHQEYNLVKNRYCRTIKVVVRFGFEEFAKLAIFSLLTSVGDPSTFQEAMNSLEKDR